MRRAGTEGSKQFAWLVAPGYSLGEFRDDICDIGRSAQ